MELSTFALTFLAVGLAIYYIFFRKNRYFEKLGVPYVEPYPIFGNMAEPMMRRRTLADMIDKAYKLEEEAKYVGFYDFFDPVIVIRSPELIKDIAVKNFDHFVDHRGFADPDIDPLFGGNLFSLRGQQWRHMRSVLTPAFTGSKMKTMFDLVSATAKNFADFLCENSAEKPFVVDSKDAFSKYTTDVIASFAFGINIDSMRNPTNEFYSLGKKALDFEGLLTVKFLAARNFPRLTKFFKITIVEKRLERFFENVVRENVEMREREGIFRPDMIQLMMESRANKTNAQPGLTIKEMTSQAFAFFFGGFDTTSNLLCTAVHSIAVYPDVQKRLHEEIDGILAEKNGDVTYEDIGKMEYIEAVLSEALRLYPISAVLDRLCVKPYQLPPSLPGGEPVTVQPGQSVWFPTHSLDNDPKYFHDPETFDPERFLGSARDDIDPFAHFPFGQGPRMCIGNRFAMLKTKLLIFNLLAKCRVRPSSKMILPLRLSKASMTAVAEGGFWFEVEPRKKPKMAGGAADSKRGKSNGVS